MAGKDLTSEMLRVLRIADRDGGSVSAGTGAHKGSIERVPASTVLSLIRRGLLEHRYGSEGGVGGRLTETGRAALAEHAPSSGHAARKKPAPYTSESLAVSRRMVAPGPLYEERAIIHDLMWRYGHLQSTLRYVDRTAGKPIAAEAEKLRQETWKRIEQLPEGALRTNLTQEMYK